ncbi:S-adenosyl-L-methionine-dependent methyltransferase [Ochromonadaceae sp. CCMP2298]|nr:S-adenosyl-L-methionine-dependent methyltransferase [Ochromonadaceae sp. CCMP2298]
MQEGIQYVHKICPAQVDEFIPSLIPIPAGISFGENEWVKSGRLVIQDKASCFPSQILYDAWCSQGCGDIGGGGKGGITREISDNIGSGSGSGGSSNSDRGNSDIGAGTREPGTYGSGCGGDIIDACAAPGNKTSHIAALIALTKDANTKNPKSKGSKDKAGGDMDKNPSRVFAFEKNPRRAALLRQRMELMGAHNVVVVNEDFLLADVHNPLFANVTAILLDPSCSGSGVVRSLERALEQDSAESLGLPTDTAKRLNKLQAFQLQAVHKAMCFPHVSNVVYSTCSIHLEENEHVVARVLSWCGDSGDGGGGVGGRESSGSGNSSGGREWTVEAPGRFKTWSRRGLPLTDTNTDTDTDTDTGCTLTAVESQALIRCAPEDGTNGFFVALFSKNPHFRGASVSSGQIGYSGYSGKSGSGRKNVGVADQKPVLKRQREDGVTAQKVSMAKPAKGEKVDGTVSTPSVPKPPRTPRVDSSLFGSRFKVSKASRKSKH